MDHYQAPNLPDEDIGSALSSGLLGEQIAHVTVEQLKSASPALVLQLCVSMLQKLDVDTDHLGQPFLQPQLDEPDQYQNATFFALHIPRLFCALVPGCNPKRICTADLLNPKWIKLKKFLSILINYFRFMETNKPAFTEINTKSEELHKNIEESEDRNSKLRGALLEIDEYMTRNSELHHERHCEKEELEKKLQNILAQKDMKHNSKEGSKKSAEKATEAFNSLITQHDHILEKINDIKKLVVTSPKKQILERAELKQKLDVTNEDEANVQDQIQAQQWSIEKHEDIIKRLEYTLKLWKKYLEFYDKLKTIKTGLMKEKFQTDEDKMALVCIRQEIDNLKQMKLDERDQIHRTKLRGQNIWHTKSSIYRN